MKKKQSDASRQQDQQSISFDEPERIKACKKKRLEVETGKTRVENKFEGLQDEEGPPTEADLCRADKNDQIHSVPADEHHQNDYNKCISLTHK